MNHWSFLSGPSGGGGGGKVVWTPLTTYGVICPGPTKKDLRLHVLQNKKSMNKAHVVLITHLLDLSQLTWGRFGSKIMHLDLLINLDLHST